MRDRGRAADHARPRGATVDLALVRRPAVDQARKIGTLFANPGGPGGSGVDFVRTAPPAALAVVTANFDFVGWDPDVDAGIAVRAADQAYPRRPGPVLAAGRLSAGLFPRFGWLSGVVELPSALMPVEAAQPYRGPFGNPADAAPVLVIGGTHDPATPYLWSQRLVAQLGNARLLTFAGDGHGTLTALDGCVIGATFGYLERGVLPAPGAVCVQDRPFLPYRPARSAAPEWTTGERLP